MQFEETKRLKSKYRIKGKASVMEEIGHKNRGHNNNVWKGFAAGLMGGLIASWTMNRFQDVWNKLAEGLEDSPGKRVGGVSVPADVETSPTTEVSKPDTQPTVQDDTTVKAASAVSEGLFHHRLTEGEKKIAGPAVHYLLGTGVGGLYGASAELAPKVTAGAGLPFGAAFWLVVDEGAVPLLGLSKGPASYPLSTHAYALASHFVYGFTAETVRRAIRNTL
jgi:putative membrane protein